MGVALDNARLAAKQDEVPVGAVLLDADGRQLAAGHNFPISSHDPTGHAEIRCLRAAASTVGNYRLPGNILVVTLEPCLMCLGALVHARVAGVVFGAADPKSGAVLSCLNGAELPFFNHRFWVVNGVLGDECSQLLSGFFAAKRNAR